MIRMGKESKLPPEKIIEAATAFFGPEGWGMTVEAKGACCARFEGSDGYVFVQTAVEEGNGRTKIDVEGRQWEPQIQEFMGKV